MRRSEFSQNSGLKALMLQSSMRFDWLVSAGTLVGILVLAFVVFTSGFALAADDDGDDDASKATHAAAGEKSLRRQYQGGRDEEELTVQAALPQPVRNPDAVPGTADAGASSND